MNDETGILIRRNEWRCKRQSNVSFVAIQERIIRFNLDLTEPVYLASCSRRVLRLYESVPKIYCGPARIVPIAESESLAIICIAYIYIYTWLRISSRVDRLSRLSSRNALSRTLDVLSRAR